MIDGNHEDRTPVPPAGKNWSGLIRGQEAQAHEEPSKKHSGCF